VHDSRRCSQFYLKICHDVPGRERDKCEITKHPSGHETTRAYDFNDRDSDLSHAESFGYDLGTRIGIDFLDRVGILQIADFA